MKIKIIGSTLLSILTLTLVIGVAFAGAVFDYGTLDGNPPLGQVNWFAWLNEPKNILAGGMPNEIMTEDSTNCDEGLDIGYSEDIFGNLIWLLQVENFTDTLEAHGDQVDMIFGGLGASSGKLWFYSFNWDLLVESVTNHSTPVPLSGITKACPTIKSTDIAGNTRSFIFGGVPGTYLVYKSTQGSGAFNNASNGRYQYLKTVTAPTGSASFSDTDIHESWYVVVQADPETNLPIGCHSEEASPTAVTVTDFTSDYGLTANRVSLQWSTASEFGLLGFEVFRSQSLDGARELIAQVASQNPGGLQEASYTLDDADITPGQVYFYWLDILKADGSRETWGPLEQQAGYQRYLPFLTR